MKPHTSNQRSLTSLVLIFFVGRGCEFEAGPNGRNEWKADDGCTEQHPPPLRFGTLNENLYASKSLESDTAAPLPKAASTPC